MIVPYTTAQKRLLGITHLHDVWMSADPTANVESVAADLTALLRSRHKIGAGEDDDFMVPSLEEIEALRYE